MFRAAMIRRIASGEYRGGCALPSTGTLAENAGLSYVSVHRVLKELESEGYLVRRNGIGTFVLPRAETPCISRVAVPLYLRGMQFFSSCYEEISSQASALGIHLHLGGGEPEEEVDFLNRAAEAGCKAVLRFPTLSDERKVRETLQKNRMRAVMLNDWWYDGGKFPAVRSDEGTGMLMMLEELYKRGHRKIAILQESRLECRWNLMKAAQKWQLDHHLDCDTVRQYCFTDYGEPSTLNALRRAAGDGATAVFFAYMVSMKYVRLSAIKENFDLENFCRKVTVCGFNDNKYAQDAGFPVVAQDVKKLVATAFRILLTDEYNVRKNVLIPCRLMMRDFQKLPK